MNHKVHKVISETAQVVIDVVYEALTTLSEIKEKTFVLQISLETPTTTGIDGIRLTLAEMVDPLLSDKEVALGYPTPRVMMSTDRNDAAGCLHKLSVTILNDLDDNGNQAITFHDEHQRKGEPYFAHSSFLRYYSLDTGPDADCRAHGWARIRAIDLVGEDIVQFLHDAEIEKELVSTFATKAK